MDNQFVIIGAGGFAKEVYNCLLQRLQYDRQETYQIEFVVEDQYHTSNILYGRPVLPLSTYNFTGKQILIAIAAPEIRKRLAQQLDSFHFATLIHPSASIGMNVQIGKGSIICQQVVLTCDIHLGEQCQLNLATTIGHDCTIGDYFTTAPGANISGSCSIGREVYLGTQAAIREKTHITDNVIVGMGGVVVKDINESGIYIGFPVKRTTK